MIKKMMASCWICMIGVGVVCFGETNRVADGLAPVTPVSGKWQSEGNKWVERSDSSDEGRPLFAVGRKAKADNVIIFADIEVYDAQGEVLLCPVWLDADNYVAVELVDMYQVRILEVSGGRVTVLAEKEIPGMISIGQPLRLGIALSGSRVRGYLDNELVLETGTLSGIAGEKWAIGGRKRKVGFKEIKVEDIIQWENESKHAVIHEGVTRKVFLRMEKDAAMELKIENQLDKAIGVIKVKTKVRDLEGKEIEIKAMGPKSMTTIQCPIPAERLRADDYTLVVRMEAEGCKTVEKKCPFSIVNRPNAERMPVLTSGTLAKAPAEIGFTRIVIDWGITVDYKYLWKNARAGKTLDKEEEIRRVLDIMEEAMKAGMDVALYLSPRSYLRSVEYLVRVNRDGTVRSGDERHACALLPEARKYCQRVAEAVMRTYGANPGLKGILLDSECRDRAEPCFHKEDQEACLKATGKGIPEEVNRKDGVSYKQIKGFPESRVIPDDYGLLKYYSWYWKEGDGWVGLHDQMFEVIHGVRKDIDVWFDPALRGPPVYGCGGKLSMIGHWVYTNPDPVRVGMPADELLTMAQGRQKIFMGVQGIWYRSATKPKGQMAKGLLGGKSPFSDDDEEGVVITTSPAHQTEGLWVMLSRPVDMIDPSSDTYFPGPGMRLPPETAKALTKLLHEVVAPYGPMLRKIGNRKTDVAFLESFASAMFAQRRTYGWAGGEIGSEWLACKYAGLQMDIVYEEGVLEGCLGGYKVLVMAGCEVLPAGVDERVKAFQKRGGIVIGDKWLVPGIKPDILMSLGNVSITNGQAYKIAHLEAGRKIREGLAGKYEDYARSDNPEVLLHVRENGNVQYVFAVNDRREYGDYVGTYGMVMENGLPAEAEISIRRKGVKIIDLVEMKEVKSREEDGITRFRIEIDGGSGKIYVIAEKLPVELELKVPEEVERGKSIEIGVHVKGAKGTELGGVVPVEVRVEDPAFRAAEPSGYYAAEKGRSVVKWDVAENDRIGTWKITAKELMTGISETKWLKVK